MPDSDDDFIGELLSDQEDGAVQRNSYGTRGRSGKELTFSLFICSLASGEVAKALDTRLTETMIFSTILCRPGMVSIVRVFSSLALSMI